MAMWQTQTFLHAPPVLPHRRHRRLSSPPHLRQTAPCCALSPDLDAYFMREAVSLARLGAGQTRPNPPVGCVLVSPTGLIIGRGLHHRAGLAHAEANAIADCYARNHTPRNATAYVTLEPCNHYGRTPPCAAALLRERVARVVVGVQDPDPRTAGGGIGRLKKAGVQVSVGVEERLCRELAEGFLHRVEKGSCMGVLKYAMTLDGKIATGGGSSKWVTGPEARGVVQEIRRGCDAIIVGGETVRRDDPRLTVRYGQDAHVDTTALQPIRVVMTRKLNLPREARLWDVSLAETVVFCDNGHGNAEMAGYLRRRGVVVVEQEALTTRHVMRWLYERGCLCVLWECGGRLAAQAILEDAVQKIHAFVAPKIVGEGVSPVEEAPLASIMSQAVRVGETRVRRFGNGDLVVSGYLEKDGKGRNGMK